MKTETIYEIIELNNQFYERHAEEFSKTRSNSWRGWEKLIPIIKNTLLSNKEIDNMSVLDLGCGNARFYKFLKDAFSYEVDYFGIDNNDFLMIEAILKYPEAEFKKLDVIRDLNKIENKYDLVAAFGLTHHIPGKDFRLKWFETLTNMVNNNGLLVLTFWNLQSDPRFEKAERAENLEKNDYFYGWGNSNSKRYVHIYDKDEVAKISKIFKNNGFILVDSFDADGKNNKMNTYLVLQLIS